MRPRSLRSTICRLGIGTAVLCAAQLALMAKAAAAPLLRGATGGVRRWLGGQRPLALASRAEADLFIAQESDRDVAQRPADAVPRDVQQGLCMCGRQLHR